MINIIDKHDCCGCSACVQRCPKQCIELVEDDEGFLYPHVDINKCIDCNICEKVCPLINRTLKLQSIETIAVKNLNDKERMASSSGGVFFALAKKIIEKGGVVFGAIFDQNWEVKHTYAETIEAVRPMIGSKYLQSRIEQTYKEAEEFLKQGREVMFVGSPCQISGLKSFLGNKDYFNLLAVDFLCHGVPSPGVWRRYLHETFCLDNINNRKGSVKQFISYAHSNAKLNISNIQFRNKTENGWKKSSLVVRGRKFNNDKDSILKSTTHSDDSFMRGFLSNIYLRKSCYRCKSKNGISHSDITIADYWGIDKLMPDFDDDRGVSLVLVNTEKGKAILNNLDIEKRISSLEAARNFNGGFKEHIKEHPKRSFFFKELDKGQTIEEAVNKSLKTSFLFKSKNKIKNLVKHFISKKNENRNSNPAT